MKNSRYYGKKNEHTRIISPRLGILGMLGFFGFYYEGKMSDTLIDERFLANQQRAAAQANKISLVLIILTAIFSISILRLNAHTMLSVLIAVIGFSFGLSIFLQQYLLYRYENEE